MNKYITTDYKCSKCQKEYEFSVKSNIIGIKQFKCKHFLLKFITNLDNNFLKYLVSIKCLKCNSNLKNPLMLLNNQSMQNNNSYNYFCCQNQINFSTYFSEQKVESVNNINNLNNIDNNNMPYNRANCDPNMNMNMNNNFMSNFNNNQMSNNGFNQSFSGEINNNYNNEFNLTFPNNNFNGNQMMNNMMNNNCNDFQNNQNMNMNGNYNNMNEQFSNLAIGQNVQYMNSNNMNNFQGNANQGFNQVNSLQQFSQVINNNNQFISNITDQRDDEYIKIHGAHRVLGEMISFYFLFRQDNYPVNNVKNTEKFGDVLNNFLSQNPEIKNNLRKNQRYSVNGILADKNKSLYENGIRNNSKILIQ